MSQTHSVTGRLVVSAISTLSVDRFGRSLRFCNLEFESFLMISLQITVFLGEGSFLSDNREQSFCGPS